MSEVRFWMGLFRHTSKIVMILKRAFATLSSFRSASKRRKVLCPFCMQFNWNLTFSRGTICLSVTGRKCWSPGHNDLNFDLFFWFPSSLFPQNVFGPTFFYFKVRAQGCQREIPIGPISIIKNTPQVTEKNLILLDRSVGLLLFSPQKKWFSQSSWLNQFLSNWFLSLFQKASF